MCHHRCCARVVCSRTILFRAVVLLPCLQSRAMLRSQAGAGPVSYSTFAGVIDNVANAGARPTPPPVPPQHKPSHVQAASKRGATAAPTSPTDRAAAADDAVPAAAAATTTPTSTPEGASPRDCGVRQAEQPVQPTPRDEVERAMLHLSRRGACEGEDASGLVTNLP